MRGHLAGGLDVNQVVAVCDARPDFAIHELVEGAGSWGSFCWDKTVVEPLECRAVACFCLIQVEAGVVDLGARLPAYYYA